MIRPVLAALVASTALAGMAHAQSIPTMARPVTLAGPQGLSQAMALKADVAGGSMTNATLSAVAWHVPGTAPFITCPIDACITSSAMGGNVFSPAEIQYVTQKTTNEEIGLQVSVLDNTGAGTETPGAAISPGGKQGAYFGIMQTPQGGTAWAGNSVLTRGAVPYQPSGPNGEPGTGMDAPPGSVAKTIGSINWEFDLNNRDQDGANGDPFVVNLYVAGSNLFTNTAGIFYAGNNGQPNVPMYHDGINFSAPSTNVGSSVKDNAINDLSSATTTIHTSGAHSTATIYDESTGPHSLWVTGTHSEQDIELDTASPRQIQLDGASTAQSILDNTTGPHGYQVMGTHSGADIEDASGSPIAFEMQGDHTSYDINDNTTSPIGVNFAGSHSISDIQFASSTNSAMDFAGTYADPIVDARNANGNTIFLALKAGQQVCLSGLNSCIRYASNEFQLTNSSGTNIAAIDDNGNMTIKGTLTQSGSP